VRRDRAEPSPPVRKRRRELVLGRLDAMLRGDFDPLTAAEQPHQA
jgi:hypothetical protein